MSELTRPEEEAVRCSAPGMVHGMSIADPAHARQAQQERDGKATVHETIVHHHVSDAEERHSCARSDRQDREDSVHVAPDHDERRSDGGMGGRESVVELEASRAARVMRAVDPPQTVMPHAAVQETRPGLHRGGHRQRHERAQHDRGERRHDEAS